MLLVVKVLYITILVVIVVLGMHSNRMWVRLRYMTARRVRATNWVTVIIASCSAIAALVASSIVEIGRIALLSWFALAVAMIPLLCVPVYAGMARTMWKGFKNTVGSTTSSQSATPEGRANQQKDKGKE